MNYSSKILDTKLSLSILVFFSLISLKALGQSRFPALLLGEGTLTEITQLPGYPSSEFVAVQFCGPRNKCTVTTYYVDKLKEQGVDISFFPVFDPSKASTTTMLNNFPVTASIDWGMHVNSAAADQVYILNNNQIVIYQGTLKSINSNIIKEIKTSAISSSGFSNLITQQNNSTGNSSGNWLYKGYVHPMNLTVSDFLKTAIRGRHLIYDEETGNKQLKKASFRKNKLIVNLLAKIGLTPVPEEDRHYTIKVNGVTSSSIRIEERKKSGWKAVLDKVNNDQIITISNYHSLPSSINNEFTNRLDDKLTPSKIIEQLQASGLAFQILSTKKINILKIQAL